MASLLQEGSTSLAEPLTHSAHRVYGGHHVDRLFRALLLIGAARCLAIDSNDLGRRLRRDPGDEAAPEGLRVERGDNIAQMIMRGRAVATGAEPAPRRSSFLSPKRATSVTPQPPPAPRAGRAAELPGLPMIRHISEITRKTVVSAKASRFSASPSIEIPRLRIIGYRQIQRFGRLSPTSSPDYPGNSLAPPLLVGRLNRLEPLIAGILPLTPSNCCTEATRLGIQPWKKPFLVRLACLSS